MPKKERGKHNKFEALWIMSLKISKIYLNNTYRLQNLEGDQVFDGPVTGGFLKKFFI
jgi:hypothetical protein